MFNNNLDYLIPHAFNWYRAPDAAEPLPSETPSQELPNTNTAKATAVEAPLPIRGIYSPTVKDSREIKSPQLPPGEATAITQSV